MPVLDTLFQLESNQNWAGLNMASKNFNIVLILANEVRDTTRIISKVKSKKIIERKLKEGKKSIIWSQAPSLSLKLPIRNYAFHELIPSLFPTFLSFTIHNTSRLLPTQERDFLSKQKATCGNCSIGYSEHAPPFEPEFESSSRSLD